MLSIILVASIAVAVVLGYKTKINTGFFCIAFAYLIGCFGMGIKPKELISFWPVSTMFCDPVRLPFLQLCGCQRNA